MWRKTYKNKPVHRCNIYSTNNVTSIRYQYLITAQIVSCGVLWSIGVFPAIYRTWKVRHWWRPNYVKFENIASVTWTDINDVISVWQGKFEVGLADGLFSGPLEGRGSVYYIGLPKELVTLKVVGLCLCFRQICLENQFCFF